MIDRDCADNLLNSGSPPDWNSTRGQRSYVVGPGCSFGMTHLFEVMLSFGVARVQFLLVSVVVVLFFVVAGDRPALAQPGAMPKSKPAKVLKTEPAPPVKMENPDPEWLPPWFKAPPEPLEIMGHEQPIVGKEELAKLKKDRDKLSKALRDCDLSPAGRAIISGGIRYKLAQMTLRESRNDLPKLHKQLVQDLTVDTGIGNPATTPANKLATAQYAADEVLKQIPELIKNNFYVRLHAVAILSELDFPPSHVLLLQVIQAKDIKDDPIEGQPEAIKIFAVNGLIRILKFTPIAVKDRNIIAHAVIEELKNSKSFPWYQQRLIEVLRHTTIPVDPGDNNRPFVIESLLAVIQDPERTWEVRSFACRALGRVPVPASVNPDDIAASIAEFALDLANAAAANLNNPQWKWCFWNVYLAFKPEGTKDKTGKDLDQDAEMKNPGGLLARFKSPLTPYNRIVPIVRDILHDKAPDPQDVKNLSDFVELRKPKK